MKLFRLTVNLTWEQTTHTQSYIILPYNLRKREVWLIYTHTFCFHHYENVKEQQKDSSTELKTDFIIP